MIFVPDAKFIVHETPYWRVNQRVDSALPGYLMVSPKDSRAGMLCELSPGTLSEMGVVLAETVRALNEMLKPVHVYVSRLGHMAGFSWHFHVIPVYDWVKNAYLRNERYRALSQFYAGRGNEPDGHDLSLFVAREFCESPNPPPVEGPCVDKAIEMLRLRMQGLE